MFCSTGSRFNAVATIEGKEVWIQCKMDAVNVECLQKERVRGQPGEICHKLGKAVSGALLH